MHSGHAGRQLTLSMCTYLLANNSSQGCSWELIQSYCLLCEKSFDVVVPSLTIQQKALVVVSDFSLTFVYCSGCILASAPSANITVCMLRFLDIASKLNDVPIPFEQTMSSM